MSAATVRRCDVAIVGGGMVGASLACALRGTGRSVLLIEAVAPESAAQPSFDDRLTALGNGARRIFETLGLWSAIASEAAPIRQIHVSDAGHFGFARLDAAQHDLPAFGYTVSNRHIGASLWQALRAHTAGDVEMLCPARVTAVQFGDQAAEILLQQQGQSISVQAKLLVAADGAHSLVKQAAGIESHSTDYGQVAVITNVRTDRMARGIAYERFTDSGPLAMLPRFDGSYTVVWTVASAAAGGIQALDETQFNHELQQRFGWRAGRIVHSGVRAAYPLTLVRAEQGRGSRAVLIGNASQALHPVAAQGFNLGLRDAAELAELIVGASDPGDEALLKQFVESRAADRRGMIGFTDQLVKLFSYRSPGVISARNAGLLLFDLTPWAKQALSRVSWGFGERMPRLARGLPLSSGRV